MSTKSMHKLISVIVLITLLAAALPVPAMAAEQPGDVVPYELAPAEAKQHVLASKTPQTRTREPLAPHATSDLVSIDWYADTSPDGQGAGRLDGVLVTFTSTDGTVNGGELAMSADWATLASTDGVPGIDSPRIVDEGIALDWNAGAAGTAKISFGAATVTDPILLFGSTDDPIQTFDFDDGLSLTLLDQNPTGTTILAGNVISTSGGHTNAASDGFAVQIQGTFSEISFATNTNLAAAQSVMVTVAAEAQNIRRPTPSSPALVMPNFVSAAADYNDTGTYTSTFAIPAGAKYAQFSNYTFPIDTDTSGGIEEDWYATTAFADLAAAEVSGVAAMWRADVDAWEVEYAFQGTPFGTNTMDSPNFEGDTNPRHINYNVTASGGNFMIAEESTLADLRGTYLTEFYDTDESMTLLASDQIFFYANMSQGQQEIPVDTDVIIIDAYFGPYNASSDQNQEENFATGRLIIDLGDNSVVGRLASIDSRTDDALFNYGFTRTNVDSVAPGGLTTSADPSLSRTGDYTLTSSANWLYDPDIYVTDETTLTIDHAPVGSTSTFTDTNAGSYFIQYFDRQETPSPNVFLGATANATGSGAHLGIGTIGTAAYGYVTTMGHNSGPGDPFDDDKYFSYSLLDMEHGISSGHYTRIQGWQTIGSQYRDGKAWHDIPLSTAINGYTTTDEILRTYALSLDYAANEITFDSDNFVRWGIDKAAVAFWFGPPPTCPGDVCDDLALWLRADVGTDTTVDGTDISAWQDQSALGNNANPGGTVKLPDYYADQINGNPIARFDGNHDHMDFYSQLGLGGNDPFAIYSVFKIPDSSNYRTIIGPGTDANHNNGFQYRVSGTGMELVKEQDRLILSGNGIVDNDIPQLTSLNHASGSFIMYLAGGDDGSATDSPNFQIS
ncbi:MAG: hypothetical protein GY832_37865, partial [Chloroflexi bacterium]|nr:hypothetical protein [Chloroflexota bacterium]